MAGVMADQGHVQQRDAAPPPATTGTDHLQVTPENVLTLAESFGNSAERLDAAMQGVEHDLRLPDDAFLGDPYSKWAVLIFNDYFLDRGEALATMLRRLVDEHKRTFNALKAIADSYGKTDEWNARRLGKAFDL